MLVSVFNACVGAASAVAAGFGCSDVATDRATVDVFKQTLDYALEQARLADPTAAEPDS
ncbi:MAG TPA: hypothetical protein VGC72_04965 [Candidatus Elarobacter sp.]|jgi:hypothetical protein